ncbi:hypothetical protein V9K67_21555 [Paraflavisolibacter sp. H34]|uniref:hypothetical protein n=1 Tax=Huijunlia imazamoxiresistens TaxID=3127457 RepID=UPI00301B34EE
MRQPKTEEEFQSINGLRRKEVLESLAANPGMAFQDIFKIFPKTAFCLECGLHSGNFPRKIEDPESIRVEEIYKIAGYLELEPEEVFAMIARSIQSEKKASGGKKK